jgi:hypothetical protein
MKAAVRLGESGQMLGWLVATFGVYAIVDGMVRGKRGTQEYVQGLMEAAAAETGFEPRDVRDPAMFEWLISLGRKAAAESDTRRLH